MTFSATSEFYIVLDSGTSSSKVFVITKTGAIAFTHREKHSLRRPAPFHVESDARDTFQSCYRLLRKAVRFVTDRGGAILHCGFTVQRSTFLFWDKKSKATLSPALNWQDSRAKEIVDALKPDSSMIRSVTGVPLSAHFGGPKFLHLISHDLSLKDKVKAGTVWFGPLSAYLTHCFTQHAYVDESIAGRSTLMDIDTAQWSPELLDVFQVNPDVLPPLVATNWPYGIITIDDLSFPLSCVVGDQQAALIGQGGWLPNSLAMNFGTSGSVQLNTGGKPVHNPALLASVLTSDSATRSYILEGTINACNSLFYWLENELGISHHEMVWHKRAEQHHTDGILIPGFIGLAAPYWTDQFETVLYKLERFNENDIVRAGMESIGLLVNDIVESMKAEHSDCNALITASGGGARPALLQFIADILRRPIGHSAVKDRTAVGVYNILYRIDTGSHPEVTVDNDIIFHPKMIAEQRDSKIASWHTALESIGIRANN